MFQQYWDHFELSGWYQYWYDGISPSIGMVPIPGTLFVKIPSISTDTDTSVDMDV